jgi:pilus assembly protein CpaC
MTKHKSIIYPDTLKQLLMFVLLSLTSVAMAADRIVLEFGGIKKTSELRLSIGKSQIIYSQQPLDQVVIGNPEIADIKLLSSRQVLILGNKPGHTNLVFRDKDRSNIALMDVVVGYDLEGVKRKLYEVMPQEELIQVRGANDAVMLSGEVSSALALDVAVAVAASYVPKNKVINMLQVGGGQQVMLEVKIAEISRDATREFGIGITAGHGTVGSGTRYDFSQGVVATTGNLASGVGGVLTITDIGGDIVDSLTGQLRLLEGKGLAKTLAEPNLVAMSGQEASFLAGGEFPYQVLGEGSLVGVEFKEFGVGLKFTPTVLNSEKINLKFSSEVSSISTVSSPPSISTRRASTTVEMADGQSFAVAGLLQSDMQNAADQLPGLGDIPILGALFRSSRFKRQETEMVVIVTPRLVKPVAAGTLVAPTDNFIPPSWLDQYLLGNLEGTADRAAKSDKSARSKQTDSGLEGEYGHKVYEPATNEKGAITDKSDQYEEKANGQ